MNIPTWPQLLWLLLAVPTQAANLPVVGSLDGGELRMLSGDLGAALSHKPLAPALAWGPHGWRLDAGLSMTSYTDAGLAALNKAAGAQAPAYDLGLAVRHLQFLPRLRLSGGLGGWALAADAAKPGWAPGATLLGIEAVYAPFGARPTTGGLALRAAATRLFRVGELRFMTRSLALEWSKPLRAATPYVGIGRVWVDSQIAHDPDHALHFMQGKIYTGLSLGNGNGWHYNMEIDRTAMRGSLSLSAQLRW